MNYSVNGGFYELETGEQLPRISNIIGQLDKSEGLMNWTTKCMAENLLSNLEVLSSPNLPDEEKKSVIINARYAYKEVSEEALDVGTQVHKLIELYIRHGCDPTKGRDLAEQVVNAFLAFLEWEKENTVEWLYNEVFVFSLEHGFAGTFDALAKIKNKVYLIDFKSSKAIYDTMALQLAGYNIGLDEMRRSGADLPKVEAWGVLRLDKETGKPEFKDYGKSRGGFEAFRDNQKRSFLALTDFFYNFKKRRLKNNPVILRNEAGK